MQSRERDEEKYSSVFQWSRSSAERDREGRDGEMEREGRREGGLGGKEDTIQ